MKRLARYQTRDEVDFVIIGSGAAGGVLAKELSEAGFRIVALEQGPYLSAEDFNHDEYGHWFKNHLTGSQSDFPSTFRGCRVRRGRGTGWGVWGRGLRPPGGRCQRPLYRKLLAIPADRLH